MQYKIIKLEAAENEINKLKSENQQLKDKLQHLRLQDVLDRDEEDQFNNEAFDEFT